MSQEPVVYVAFHDKSVFMPFRYVYPECSVLLKDHLRAEPLHCLRGPCTVGASCMDPMAHRVNYLFDNVFPEDAELLVAYYKVANGSIKAGVFWKDLREPYTMLCNRSAIYKFQTEGDKYSWMPTSEYLLIGGKGNNVLIPERDLVRVK